jgi:hypothetical protein
MDDTDTSMGELNPGISIRNGPVEAMDVDPPATNGNGIKRKSSMNGKSYKDTTESDDDDVPLVRRMPSATIWQDLTYSTDQTQKDIQEQSSLRF